MHFSNEMDITLRIPDLQYAEQKGSFNASLNKIELANSNSKFSE